jgi:hypothetical protein
LYRKRRSILFYIFFLLFLTGIGMLGYGALLLTQTQKVRADGVDKIEIPRSGVYRLYHEYELEENGKMIRMPVFSDLEKIKIQSEKGTKAEVIPSAVQGGYKDGENRGRQIGIIEFKKAGRYTIRVKETKEPLVFQISRSTDIPVMSSGVIMIVIGIWMCAAIDKRTRENVI